LYSAVGALELFSPCYDKKSRDSENS
jgi:hypothetical protein